MAIMKSKQKAGHAAGIYSDMTLDGPEIGTLVIVVDRAKNLPNRKTMGKQDPYCAMRLAKEAKKTNTDRRGGQTPKWDQELRFVVHDSPDYYKLKCSVFNDDKKTELIGEAWIDLSDVIKLGGGTGDHWQQLNFKGKYAGEIRIELSYYDIREQPQEKKRKERHSTPVDSSSELSLPSQKSLGPREIKRRPLPSSPAGSTPQQTPAYIETTIPEPPSKLPSDGRQQSVHAPVPLRPRGRSESPLLLPLPDQQPQQHYSSQNEHYADSHLQQHQHVQWHDSHQSHQSERQQPWQQSLGYEYKNLQPEHQHLYNDRHKGESQPRDDYEDQELTYPDEQEIWQHQRPHSVHAHSEPVTPQYSSPVYRPAPMSANSDSQIVRHHRQQRSDASPCGTPLHTQSPLKQSMSHHDIHSQPPQSDAPPPLPPKHRDTPPRRSRSEYPPSAFIPQPLRIGAPRSSVSDRSPLQSLEDGYDTQRQEKSRGSLHATQTPLRHSTYIQLPHSLTGPQDQQLELYDPRPVHGEQSHELESRYSQQRPQQGRRNSYEIRHSSFGQQMIEEPQSMPLYDNRHSNYDDTYQPTVEDAPPSPGIQPMITRKAVGAQPKRLNGMPFGPDAYDVLNPDSSPVTNEKTAFETTEQAKESQRLREVEKIRDLGPIIGNDGREIDPSDHLPADTWAPEPERKDRKPEHVIHIRSKNGASRPAGARASPIVIHNRGNTTASAHSSPAPAPQSQPVSSPATRTMPSNFIGGRNRLQKQMPSAIRPLPNQPYVSPSNATLSSPALASSLHQSYDVESQYQQRPLQPRRPSYENRVPSHLTRPSLNEYQVPVGNSYTPRSDSHDSYHKPHKAMEYKSYDTTPTKQQPQSHSNYVSPSVEHERRVSFDDRNISYDRRNSYDNRSDYSYENHVEAQRPQQTAQQQQKFFDDPLAAEMSLIDIGPSRNSYHQGSMGRSMARNARW